MEVLRDLNAKQAEAVEHFENAILVIAGPGTGKTKVITHRIAHLIRHHNILPEQILAVTFTNKAAQEMLDRVMEQNLVDSDNSLGVRIHTFHAFCVSLIREYTSEIGLPRNFAIFDQEMQDAILIECIREQHTSQFNFLLPSLRDIVGSYKSKFGDLDSDITEFETYSGRKITDRDEIEAILDLISTYQAKLDSHHALDFTDLIAKSVRLLKQNLIVRERYQRELKFILVDEYQDINEPQYELLKLLCRQPENNLMAVADSDQSIYSWRGSDPKFINQFKADYHPKVVKLTDHYRCHKNILDAARSVITKNLEYNTIDLNTHQITQQNPIIHYTLQDSDQEADHVIKIIRYLTEECDYKFGDIAVFYRNHLVANKLENRLIDENQSGEEEREIPFQRVGGEISFREQFAKNVVAYLNFVEWRDMPLQAERAINFPQRRLIDISLARLKLLAQCKGIEFCDIIERVDDYPQYFGPLTRKNINQFLAQINYMKSKLEEKNVVEIVDELFLSLAEWRLPYLDSEILELRSEAEIPNVQEAVAVLYQAIFQQEPIQIISGNDIDASCAVYIIQQVLNDYLDTKIEVEKKGDLDNIQIIINGGKFVIQISPLSATEDSFIIQIRYTVLSIVALKLCQRLISKFERQNFEDFVVYDLATVGNNPKWAEIIEVVATKLDQMGEPLESRHQLVKPTGWIPQTSVNSYNITSQMVANKPSIEEVLPSFINFIDNQVLVGHNVASFDNEIIRRDLVKHLNQEFRNTVYCDIMAIAQRLYPRQNPAFEALVEKFNIMESGSRPTGIVDTTLKIFRQLVNEDTKRRELTSLSESLPLVGLAILYRSETAPKYNQILYQASLRYLRNHQIQSYADFLNHIDSISQAERLINQLVQNVENFKESSLDLRKSQDIDWEERTLDFMKDLSNFEQNFDAEEIGISDFLKYFNLINREPEIDKDELTLMTVHAAKGMEYRAVIIMGMEDGVFPIRYRDQTRQEIEEDRRLFYVGMTRAKERLYFTSVRQRQGNRVQAASMFIDEIPEDLIQSWASK
ncbi:TPA: hypothetical protein EYN09_04970 [Candidatus Poribacteria bacterium]|nr:hypothetical protein [Candidatus Poribacteria bacterium]